MRESSVRILALFAGESDLMEAVRELSGDSQIEEIYAPYPISEGLERTRQRRTRLPWFCFGLSIAGAAAKLWLQYWASATDWPINVGGKPWNSLPAFVPVTFEIMVLLAGLGAFFLFLARRRLYPGQVNRSPYRRTTDDGFALQILVTRAGAELSRALEALRKCGALRIEANPGGELP